MKTTKLLAGAVVAAIGGLAMTSIASATAPVTVELNGDLTVCGIEYVSDSNGSGGCITIQGKNVGATTTGAGVSTDSSYGYYFQWGNNYGFPTTGNVVISSTTVDTSDYGPNNPYSSGIFISNTYSDWSSVDNANLWGGGSDIFDEIINSYPVKNAEDRKGPCDAGYHVPSEGEWYALMDMWAETEMNGRIYSNVSQFYTAFQIPFPGYRHSEDAGFNGVGQSAYLWSSSPMVNYHDPDNHDYVYLFKVGESFATTHDDEVARSNGFSVRCFKNPESDSSSSEGGDSEIIVNIAALNGGQNTCSGEDFIFPAITASPVVQTIKLAKKFQCVFGNAAAKAVTLQLSGDLEDGNGNVISGENVKLSNPEWTATPTVLKNGNTYFSGETFLGNGQTLFNKVANKIGEAYGSGVEIKITIPAGTPNGLYEGTLVLTY